MALGRRALFVSAPVGLLAEMARLGDVLAPVLLTPLTTDQLDRLVGPLIVDCRTFIDVTGFVPPVLLAEGFRLTAGMPTLSIR